MSSGSCRGRCGDQSSADTGDIARGLAGILAQGSPPRARSGSGPVDCVVITASRFHHCQAPSDAIGEAMRNDEAHPRAAISKREHRKVPSGSVLGIQGDVGLLAQPGVEFLSRPRRGDLELVLIAGRDPAMPAERQG